MITRAEFDTMGQQIKARIEDRQGETIVDLASRGVFDLTTMLAKSDTNKDGKVSLAEMQQSALARFDRMDLNHDGKINPQERLQVRQAKKAQAHKG